MKKLATLAALLLAATFAHAQAAGAASAPKKELTPQQMLMGTCQKDATASGKKGKERQELVNTCLADGRKRQNEKMKACNADAGVKEKKGKERQAAMSACLKG